MSKEEETDAYEGSDVIPDDPEIEARVPGLILIARDIKGLISWITPLLAHQAVLRHS